MKTHTKAERRAMEKDNRIAARLREPLGHERMSRKDVLIALLICAVYAVVAFWNLGATEIPSTGYTVQAGGEDLILEFDEPQNLIYLMLYPGYGEGIISVYGSMDGENWEYMQLTNLFDGAEEAEQVLPGIVDEYGDMYKWARRHMNEEAKYVRIAPETGSVNILEFALLDQDANVVTPSSVTTSDGTPVTELTDEQDLVPIQPTYQTDFYFDEIYHVRTAYEHIHGITPYEITHPPLGKIIIALGIEMFGMNPFGWRFMGTVAGVAMLPVLYVLAKMLFRKTKYAAVAEILFAADFMHYTQTRIGTVDSFSVLWILLMYLFMYQYSKTNFNRQPLKETLKPLFLSGLFFGIGAATKWICLYAGIGLLVIWILILIKRHQEYVWAKAQKEQKEYEELIKTYPHKFRVTFWLSMLFFLLIPACIYLASYIPYTLVTDGGAYSFMDILENQKFMLTYHANLTDTHPFESMWYTWPLDIRPVLFYSVHSDVLGQIACFSTMGNPLVWWGGAIASVCLIVMTLRYRRYRSFGLLCVAIAALCQYMPWWFISRAAFIYHYFSVVPFLVLLTVYFLKAIDEKFRYGKIVLWGYTIACVMAFGFFFPVITGTPAPAAYIQALRWLPSWPFY